MFRVNMFVVALFTSDVIFKHVSCMVVNFKFCIAMLFACNRCHYCDFQLPADLKIQSSIDKCIFRYRQSNFRRLLPASDLCRLTAR